ncbi:DUF3810 domain-containing protein [Flagellimonas allohymeniacidonis]|uniref:DUF3810 domain-containing protein n=1 Tax=Flagellimonas allohymeniacidonis TaxID=2517819 RepID=A0A4Q8QKK9_9FLAO|nr:DUF3810 domain-containing protein [Allomuricauda hymeniacidonis]TAI49323.1 DUF3810 domain-containing protein [Allomuricauda hymeniacidonis]
MGKRTKTILLLALPLQIILVKWLGSYPELVEKYYSQAIYPLISQFFRILFGWIPFSIGDVLYTILGILAIRYIYRHWTFIKTKPLGFLKNILVVLSITYFLFHLLWGLNYYRLPIDEKLEITKEYSEEELVEFIKYLTNRANTIQTEITGDSTLPVKIPYSRKEIFKKTEEGYKSLKQQYPDFDYKHRSLKASIYSIPLTYMGYGGYLNPFSNEAQVNGVTPKFRLPTVSGHEVGHQLGYSAEDATNFLGFLVTSVNDDPYFQYAAYSHALAYCLSDLARRDGEKFKEMVEGLNEGVRENFREVNRFWEKYENPLEPVFKSIFNTFLKANNQEEGIQSYNSVVGLLIGYHAKERF